MGETCSVCENPGKEETIKNTDKKRSQNKKIVKRQCLDMNYSDNEIAIVSNYGNRLHTKVGFSQNVTHLVRAMRSYTQ